MSKNIYEVRDGSGNLMTTIQGTKMDHDGMGIRVYDEGELVYTNTGGAGISIAKIKSASTTEASTGGVKRRSK